MSKRKKTILFIGIILAAVILVRISKFFIKKPIKAENIIPVKIVKPVYKDVEEIINLTGDIRGLSEAKVYSKVTGKLHEKRKDVGEIVSKNEAVALVDRDEPALEFKMSEVNSPLNGVITQYFLDIGEMVTPQTPIFEVATIDKVKVVVNITEQDITKVKKDLPVRFIVDSYPSKVFRGGISKIGQSIDLQTRTVPVEISVSNESDLLKPGMFAKVELILSVHENVLTIPVDAIGEYDSKKYVYVVENSIANRKDIKTLIRQNNHIEVISGIDQNDSVVLLGWQNLSEGAKVVIAE
ncbi:MAG: hypothetical protein A2539_09350 [Elusimicrobia bacterium RIFOXYD2_FULL_34_15]|nr:MAG: hypothetical protein A2539_09350 [Elusimicrobia bacterium RIFOXYD2_FULL_34_15]